MQMLETGMSHTCAARRRRTWSIIAVKQFHWMRLSSGLVRRFWWRNWCWPTSWCCPSSSPSLREFELLGASLSYLIWSHFIWIELNWTEHSVQIGKSASRRIWVLRIVSQLSHGQTGVNTELLTGEPLKTVSVTRMANTSLTLTCRLLNCFKSLHLHSWTKLVDVWW